MGRVRGKGKRQPIIAVRDDNGSGEDEKLLGKRRGRPQKAFKDDDEIDLGEEDEQVVKIYSNDSEERKSSNSVSSKSIKNQTTVENGRKRKRASPVRERENADSVKEENNVEARAEETELIKNVGYRQNGSRRKNKPRRAAEVGVECK